MVNHLQEARQASPYYRTISDKMDIALQRRKAHLSRWDS